MTDTFSEGDLIEATNPDGAALTGRLGRREDGDLYLGCYQWTFPTWVKENAGFNNIKVIEKAAPALPTEVGFYLNRYGQLWTYEKNGWWRDDHDAYRSDDAAREVAPFTRLEPVADTAKKVLDFIGSSWEFGAPSNVLSALKDAATEFGVVYE